MKATKEGENSKNSLKVTLKDTNKFYENSYCSESKLMLIQENMKIVIGIYHDYVMKCTTRIRQLEEESDEDKEDTYTF